ncbi:serine aminopeptidase domain-containing protein [Neobacillus niacini]|uniref:alpha/beta hydrolase n=1 Tax=Neobacillus niacini TaxID=86668 RepID=UPI00285945F3|nr:alpha/beta hydrolase [Neobacillus niacini]MDR6998450.1 pimeloyl-ACP methyl ester carboxylesterase [Neobacillus niacini]
MEFREKDVTIQSKVALKGTLCLPNLREEHRPAILIIGGTGKLDRNGKVNEKLDLKLYRQLAEFLTSIGFISLRYDKQGVAESEGDYYKTGLWDLVDDSRAAVQFLKNQPEIAPDKVFVLGHSEGSMIGTIVAAREELAGVILLSGAVSTLSEALKYQREIAARDVITAKGFQGFLFRLLGVQNKIEKQAQKLTDKVLSSNKEVMKIGFTKLNAKWMREHFQYNVREDLAKVSCPVLAITGARDIQANPKDLEDLPKYVKGDVEYYIVENMGHSCKFQAQTSNILSAKKDIVADGNLPIHPELLALVEKWLNKHQIDKKSDDSVIV